MPWRHHDMWNTRIMYHTMREENIEHHIMRDKNIELKRWISCREILVCYKSVGFHLQSAEFSLLCDNLTLFTMLMYYYYGEWKPDDIKTMIMMPKTTMMWDCWLRWWNNHYISISWDLTHWGRDQIAAVLQTTFSNAFYWMTIIICWY